MPKSGPLVVCWTKPAPLPAGGTILSFMPPAEEEELAADFSGTLLRARELAAAVRPGARDLYLKICARIGAEPDANGVTLRRAAAGLDKGSPWWHHPVSFKPCETDESFGWIVAALAVSRAMELSRTKTMELWGAPPELAAALSTKFKTRKRYGRGLWMIGDWLRALGGRLKFLWETCDEWLAARRLSLPEAERFPTLLYCFWDWSVKADGKGGLDDRYYKALPEALEKAGAGPVGRLAWIDRYGEPWQGRDRAWGPALAPLQGRGDAVAMQLLLSPADILEAVLDIGPLCAFLRRRDEPSFRAVFLENDFDFWPIFSGRLLRGFLDGCLPRCALTALAAERAARRYKPERVYSFLEHFPRARAVYEGSRRGHAPVKCAAVQHASFCREKVFYFLDPSLEFRGEPDGLACPCPDTVFTMGSLAREHFLSCGYSDGQVLVTGSPRYDHMKALESEAPAAHQGLRVLLLASLDLQVEIDMAEAAWAASAGVPGVELQLRNHPFGRVSSMRRFKRFLDRVAVATGTLEENLAWADVVLFSYSTTAEEAALAGKPVWQWLPVSYNASALAEVAEVPRFTSVAGLREAMRERRLAPLAPETRKAAAERLFYKLDGGGARRIAQVAGSRTE